MLNADSTTRSASRRKRWLMFGLTGFALIAACLWAIRHFAFPPERPVAPPQPDLMGIDPAVQQAIEQQTGHVQKDIQSGDAWGQLGCVFVTHGFEEEALTCFLQAASLDPKNPMWLYFQGLSLLLRDPNSALPKMEQAVRLAGGAKVVGLRHQLAELYLSLGRLDQARKQFETILTSQPADARAHLGLARIDLQAANLNSSRRHLDAAASSEHHRREVLALSAQVYQKAGDPKAANRELAKMIELPADSGWPDEYREFVSKFQVGESARLRMTYELNENPGRSAQALASAKQLVTDYPQSPRTWAALGAVLLNQQKFAAAEQALHQSLALDDTVAEVWLNLARARRRQNDFVEATTYSQKAIERKLDFWQAHYHLGLCFKDRGQRPAAIEAFRDALLCQPLSASAHARLGELLLEDHRTEEAMEHLQQAVELDPKDDDTRKLLANARKQKG